MGYAVDGIVQNTIEKSLGAVPIMLKSEACHLNGLNPTELVERGEQETEWGGYFIIGGHERIIRYGRECRFLLTFSIKNFMTTHWKGRNFKVSDSTFGLEV